LFGHIARAPLTEDHEHALQGSTIGAGTDKLRGTCPLKFLTGGHEGAQHKSVGHPNKFSVLCAAENYVTQRYSLPTAHVGQSLYFVIDQELVLVVSLNVCIDTLDQIEATHNVFYNNTKSMN